MEKETKIIYIVMGSTGNISHDDWRSYPLKAFYNIQEACYYANKYMKIVDIAKKYFTRYVLSDYDFSQNTSDENERDYIYSRKYQNWIDFDKCFTQEIELI